MGTVLQSPCTVQIQLPVIPLYGFKTHGQSHMKAETEVTSGTTKWLLVIINVPKNLKEKKTTTITTTVTIES